MQKNTNVVVCTKKKGNTVVFLFCIAQEHESRLETNSRLHAEQVIKTYLKRKGVYPKGEEDLTLGRKELRYGYDSLQAKVVNQLRS